MLRRFHRLLGVLLVLPLLTWTATGLAFLVKPGWRGAYEALTAFRDEPLDLRTVQPLSVLAEAGGDGEAVRIELVATALGPVGRVTGPGGSASLVDARTGERLSPLEREAGLRIAVDAAGRAHAAARYGAVQEAREEGDAIAVIFSGGATIRVGRSDLSLAQSGRDSALIDWLYRIHYLQWTGLAALDRALSLGAIVGTWALAGLGLCLLRARKNGCRTDPHSRAPGPSVGDDRGASGDTIAPPSTPSCKR